MTLTQLTRLAEKSASLPSRCHRTAEFVCDSDSYGNLWHVMASAILHMFVNVGLEDLCRPTHPMELWSWRTTRRRAWHTLHASASFLPFIPVWFCLVQVDGRTGMQQKVGETPLTYQLKAVPQPEPRRSCWTTPLNLI